MCAKAVLSVLILPLANVAADVKVDVDGVWGISEQGTDSQGVNCDRWASGWGGSPEHISDTDPDIQNMDNSDRNQIRYGAADVNEDPPPCLSFADQSGFGFWGEAGISLPVDGSGFLLGEFTHYNTTTNIDLADYNPLENVKLAIVLSGGVDAKFEFTVTLVETANDDVPCKFAEAPNVPPCGEKVTISPKSQSGASIAIDGRQYTLEMLGFTNCDEESTPSHTLFTREMAIDNACVVGKLAVIPEANRTDDG